MGRALPLVGGIEGRDLRELDQDDLERMHVPRRYWECTIDGVTDDVDVDISPQEFLRRYFAQFESYLRLGIGAVLWGDNGRGKTAMAAIIAMMARRTCRLSLFLEVADLKRVVIERVRFDDERTLLERARMVDLLVLDDLGKGSQDSTGFGMRNIDELVRHRSSNRRSTIITTNLNPTDLREVLKNSTSETLKDSSIPFFVAGPDRRAEDKARIRDMFCASV